MTFQPQKDNLIKTFEENIQANIESISLNETSIIESQEIIDNFTPFCEDIDKKILTIRNNINSIKSEIVQIYKQSFSVGCGTTLGATQVYPDTSVDNFYNISYVEYNGDEPYEKLYQDLNSSNVGFGTFLVYTEDNSSVTGLGSAYLNTKNCYRFPCNSAICESYDNQIQQKNLEILELRNQLIDLIPSVNSLKTERITYQIRRWADNHTISLCRQENERLSIAIRVLNGYETQTDLDDNNIAISIVTDGLLLNLDASNLNSYPGFGDTWFDISGNGNHATRTNNAGFGGQVVYNSAGYFDYSVNTPDGTGGGTALSGNGFTMSNVVVPTTGGFSLSAFIRRNTSVKAGGDRETIFSNTTGENGWRFGIYTNSNGGALGSLYYLIGGDGGVGYQEGSLGGNTLLDGNWHMITAVFDRAATLGSYTVYGYIDGVASGSETISAGADGNVAFTPFLPGVGYRGCCDVFAGDISQVLAYNKVLTAEEVQQNFNAVKDRFIPNIVTNGLLLNLDVGDINSYSGSGDTWFDLTSNDNDGTLIGVGYDNEGYLSFDGTGDYIQVDPINRSNTTTIEVWFRVFNSKNFFSSRNPIPSGWFAVSDSYWSDFMNKYAVYPSNTLALEGTNHTTNWNITVLKEGNYTLRLRADNSSTLSIDGVQVASSNENYASNSIIIEESIFLNVGNHQISCVVYNLPVGATNWINNPAGIAWTLEYESDPTPLSTDLTVRQYLYTQQQDPPTLANFTYKERQGVHIAGNVIHFQYLNTNNDGVTLASSNIISPNVWYNLTVTLDGTTPLMYLNGSLIPSEIWPSNIPNPNLVSKAVNVNEGFIGRRGDAQGNDYLRGNIAIVRDYDRALTAAEVQQNFIAVKDRFIPSSIVTNGLVLNLDAGDVNSYSGSGDTWFDLSGNGNNGTLVNMDGSNYSDGALSFDGSDEYVQIIGNASNTPSSMTLFCFIYPTNTRPEEIIAAQDNGIGYRFMTRVYENDTGTLWGFKPTGDVNVVPPPPELVEYKGTTALTNNTWYCLAITYTTSNLVLYLNGNIELNQSNPYALTHGGNIRLGDGIGSAQTHLQGNLPIFMMYNRALTAAEIQQNFLALRGRFGI